MSKLALEIDYRHKIFVAILESSITNFVPYKMLTFNIITSKKNIIHAQHEYE